MSGLANIRRTADPFGKQILNLAYLVLFPFPPFPLFPQRLPPANIKGKVCNKCPKSVHCPLPSLAIYISQSQYMHAAY